jgi:hypothetical protein
MHPAATNQALHACSESMLEGSLQRLRNIGVRILNVVLRFDPFYLSETGQAIHTIRSNG